MSNNNNIFHRAQQPRRQSACFIYTYHLPYGIRRDICNILDADQSWRTLGGQFMGLDTTQLTLIGQAYMRNGSPTEELLNKLDSGNIRISALCCYLQQMNHCRAIEILKPYSMTIDGSQQQPSSGFCTNVTSLSRGSTLDTPTPSFADQMPVAIMGYQSNDFINGPFSNQQQSTWPQDQRDGGFETDQNQQRQHNKLPDQSPPEAPSRCHKSDVVQQQPQQQQNKSVSQVDPGEEIVRMACANNRKRTSISNQDIVNQLRLIMQITYKELKQASNDFSDSNILGNGGFASVYRGHWKGTDVAIKRLKCNLMDQALNELTILNSYRIDNILPIYGISIDGPEACLVYQFMSNGSLEDRLSCKKNTQPLTWNQRALIGEGVAKGLYYLHTLRDKPLVHGDVKSANVLLDSQFVPKLGDFGLARQVFKGKNPQTEHCTHCTVSSIHGTSVYLPPEYLRHKILSPAVDVYSYGIVLLEMATGRRAYDGKRLLIDVVEDETQSMSMGQIGYSLKDSRLADDTQSDLRIWFELLIKLGLNCAHKTKKKRLDMGQVLNRFAHFRTNNSVQCFDDAFNCNRNGTQKLISLAKGSTTVQTLTPDLAINKQQTQQITNNCELADISTTESNQNGTLGRQQQFNHNSALMSVEEDSDWKFDANYERQQPDTKDHSVEAMIPLLTELGVVGEQEIK